MATLIGFYPWILQNVDALIFNSLGAGPGAFGSGGTIVSGQYGRPGYQLRASSIAGLGGSRNGLDVELGINGLGDAAANTYVARPYFALEALPSGENALVAAIGSSADLGFAFRVKPDGTMEAGYRDGTGGSYTNGTLVGLTAATVPICPQRWYRIDFRLSRAANPWVLKWQVNGVAQTDISIPLAASTATMFLTNSYAHDFSLPTNRQVAYFADLAVSNTAADYPLGPGRSIALYPSAVQVSGAAGAYTDEAGNAVTTGSAYWRNVADALFPFQNGTAPAVTGDGKSLRMVGPRNIADTLGLAIDDYALASGESCGGVQAWYQVYRSAVVPTANHRLRLVTTGGVSTQVTGEVGVGGGTVSAVAWGTFGRVRCATGLGAITQQKLTDLSLLWLPVANDANPATVYHALSGLYVEAHILFPSEAWDALGCPPELWGVVP